MRATRQYLLTMTDPVLAKEWLSKISNTISDGNHNPQTTCLNLAITANGLRTLGLYEENLHGFSREFREGIDTDHRNRLLGDLGSSSPQNWEFGANSENSKDKALADTNIHVMLMVFAKNEATLQEYCQEIEPVLSAHKLQILMPLDGCLLKDNKVHLGFLDGVGQPAIEGIHSGSNPENTVATGEFLMGYKNEYGVYPDTPFIVKEQGDLHLLSLDAAGSGKRDLGHNCTYLVYRKMEERVDVFWKLMNENTKNEDGSLNETESIKLASKMVGRWPNGAPLVNYPDKEPEGLNTEDNFGYHATDTAGQKCPFGAHIRRNNPRDSFEGNTASRSLKLTKKHRIIRRGRSYGEPLVGTPTHHTAEGEIGLHFMCFNADIAGQFEFIQHTWANYPRFENLYNDPDPIIGTLDIADETLIQNFTIQGEPVNKCIENLQQFVTIKGGAYFFFPSISAIKYFSTL
ncbi:Dyp-type peroxidase family protein [compost metagenome]